MIESDILIIGAGVSGLMAAVTALQHGEGENAPHITIVDKNPEIGGRLATARMGSGRGDQGAQFFTVRDDRFRAWVDRWLSEDLVHVWSYGWSDGSIYATDEDGYPRYAVHGGMKRLAERLAADLKGKDEIESVDLRLNASITAVSSDEGVWRATDENGRTYGARILVITAPIPLALTLLDAGGTALAPDDRDALERIEYAPSLCGLFRVEGDVTLPEPGAIQRPGADISWIADNRRKGVSPDATVITVHAGPGLSRAHFDDEDARISARLSQAIQPYLGPGATIAASHIRRWRYALPLVLHPERYLRATRLPPLYFGGDAFGGPRVEGAALSGMAIGRALQKEEEQGE